MTETYLINLIRSVKHMTKLNDNFWQFHYSGKDFASIFKKSNTEYIVRIVGSGETNTYCSFMSAIKSTVRPFKEIIDKAYLNSLDMLRELLSESEQVLLITKKEILNSYVCPRVLGTALLHKDGVSMCNPTDIGNIQFKTVKCGMFRVKFKKVLQFQIDNTKSLIERLEKHHNEKRSWFIYRYWSS